MTIVYKAHAKPIQYNKTTQKNVTTIYVLLSNNYICDTDYDHPNMDEIREFMIEGKKIIEDEFKNTEIYKNIFNSSGYSFNKLSRHNRGIMAGQPNTICSFIDGIIQNTKFTNKNNLTARPNCQFNFSTKQLPDIEYVSTELHKQYPLFPEIKFI